MTRRQLLAASLGAVFLASCAAGLTPQPGGRPAVRLIEVDELLPEPAHAAPDSREQRAPTTATEPEQVAIDHLIGRLGAHGLDVIDIGAISLATGPDRATVRVATTHVDAEGSEQTSLYDVELVREPDGPWAVVAAKAVQ